MEVVTDSQWTDILEPMVIIFPVFCDSCFHDPKSNFLCCSAEIMRIGVALLNWNIFQESSFGKGKDDLNLRTKASLLRQDQSDFLPKDRKEMSVMSFFSPAIEMVSKGDA